MTGSAPTPASPGSPARQLECVLPPLLSNFGMAGRTGVGESLLSEQISEVVMPGNSFNLVDLIKGYLTGHFIGRMSSVLGESGDMTRAAINAAVPGLLAEFDKAVSTPEGARRITAAVDDADDSILDNPEGLFEKHYSSESGSGILNSILGGGRLSALNTSVANVSGLSGRSVSSMIGLLVPIVLSVLKKARRTPGSDRFDIASLLANQRSNIESAMPGEMFETYAGPRAASRRVIHTDTRARTRHTGTNWSWILPLAVLHWRSA
jgi:hypothetical protein